MSVLTLLANIFLWIAPSSLVFVLLYQEYLEITLLQPYKIYPHVSLTNT